MLRLAVIAVVCLVGLALTVTYFFNGVREASLLGFVQAAVAVLVTLRLLRSLRKGKGAPAGQADDSRSDKNARLIALGLVIGIGGPVLLLWLLTPLAR